MIFDIAACEEKIGYVFKDKMLLRRCFTHSSYAYENNTEDNELLEFFGDAIIQFLVTEYLYKHVYGDEGILTENRKAIVSKDPLLKAVKRLSLYEYVLVGNGLKDKPAENEKMYSSLYEAITAGIYLDGGMAAAKKFVTETIISDYAEHIKKQKDVKNEEKDGKSLLQEYVQKRKMGSVTYETLYKKGPDHMPDFRVAALLNGSRLAEGDGASKKAAEMQAAKRALAKLIKQGGN